MAINYYLIPNETAQELMGHNTKQPKYLAEIRTLGVPFKIRGCIGTEVDFYVVKLICDQSPPQAFLNKNDIVGVGLNNIVKTQARNALENLGVDMTGITNQSDHTLVEQRLYFWLLGESKTTVEVFAGR